MIERRLFPILLTLAACLPQARPSIAADRPAAEIVADYDKATFPKRDPDKTDEASNDAYEKSYFAVEVRRAELALELLKADPDNVRLPRMLLSRWARFVMDPKNAARTGAEIDEALPHFKDKKQAREASYLKAITSIVANGKDTDVALAAVDDFIKKDPKDQRGAVLLYGLFDRAEATDAKRKILERMTADFPDSSATRMVKSSLQLLDMVGKPLDLKFDEAITGHPVSIKGLKGKVVVLDFWATWCGPCIAEMPKMKELYAKYKDQGVEFIGVSLDSPKDEGGLDKLKEFVADKQIPWPQYYQGNGWESEFSQKMGISAIPQIYLVDAEGNLANVDARGKLETLIPEYLAKAKTP
ncbi:TlpA disulfide reductase family protein [Isosphaeraceae bacterium EP7]